MGLYMVVHPGICRVWVSETAKADIMMWLRVVDGKEGGLCHEMTSSVPQWELGQSPPPELEVSPTLKWFMNPMAQPSMPGYKDSSLGARLLSCLFLYSRSSAQGV